MSILMATTNAEYERPVLSGVLSLLHFDGTNGSTTFTDSAGSLSWTRYGNAQISTVQSKFGSASGYFDGDGDYITSGSSSSLKNILSSSFTISAWIYPTAIRTTGTRIFATGGGNVAWNSTNGIQCLFQLADASPNTKLKLALLNSSKMGGTSATSSNYVPLNQWAHVVGQVDIDASLMSVGVNGVMTHTALPTIGVPSSTPVGALATIPGEAGANTQAFQGYIDELCVVVGTAQYPGATYRVPVSPYT